MKNMELLAPAGSMESLKVAVYNGADAVYLGIKQFNARNNIDGFSIETLSEAVNFAHLFSVKVYLALNILFKDEELQSALDVVVEANNMGVDAFIVQDLGLVYLINKYYPNIELHASTQMAVHNLEGVRILEKLGFKRVVLARETSKTEIERIHKNSNIEIEFFVQGALCVSFSGNCYMCSHLVGKSGNRGLCQQFCRLPYRFEDGKNRTDGFLLSAKDICMLENIDEMQKLGITSLKIEGRARRPYYVAQVCRIYRDMLDNGKYSKQDYDNLMLAFNRGYTPAYFNGNANIISRVQGNNGLEIGVVTKVNNGVRFNEVFVSTNYDLNGKVGLKFIHNGQEIASVGAYDVQRVGKLYRITTTANIIVGSIVYIIQDENLEQEILKETRKLQIDVEFYATQNQPITIVAKYKDIYVSESGDACQEAKTINIRADQILKQLSRSEMFEIANFGCYIDECYILNSSINKLRNVVYDKLQQEILNKYVKPQIDKVNIDFNILRNEVDKFDKFDFEIVDNVERLANANNLVLDYSQFKFDDIKLFDEFCKNNKINGYIDLPNFATEQDINMISKALTRTSLGVVANNLYALNFNCKKIGGQFLNVYNSFTIRALTELCKLDAIFVEELRAEEINNLISNIPLITREKVYMTLLHCPFKQNLGCDCSNCGYTNKASFTINSGKKFNIKRKKTSTCVFLLKD